MLEGAPGVPALDDRVNGMIEGLGGLDVEVVGKAPTDCAQDKGVAAAEDLLTAQPDVTAIYSACGPPATGAIQSIKNAGIKPEDIILVGFDASPDEIADIKAGKEDATVAQYPGQDRRARRRHAVEGRFRRDGRSRSWTPAPRS